MGELPSAEELVEVPAAFVAGLIHEVGGPIRAADFRHGWERDRATWEAVQQALRAAARGQVPAQPASGPPRWLAGLVRDGLRELSATDRGHPGRFAVVRTLERLRLVEPPHDATYVLALESGYGDRDARSHAPGLRRDPELLDLLWDCFVVEGGGEVSLANLDRWRGPVWRRTFLDLVDGGDLPRDRVLEACLSALAGDFVAYRVAWFRETYEALEPTPGERAGHQAAYRELLGSEVPATVATAVRWLGGLAKQGTLDGPATVPALVPAAGSRTRATAVAALRLAGSLDPDGLLGAPDVARAGLAHEHADVQRLAARQLSSWGHDADLVAADLAPAVREQHGVPAPAPAIPAPYRAPVPHAADPADRVDPVDAVAALLEDAGDAGLLEGALAGLACLDDPSVLAPLRKRATALLGNGPSGRQGPAWLPGQLARVVLLAAGERPEPLPPGHAQQRFVVRRLDEVAGILCGHEPAGALLATPDDGPWVRPETLVRRVADRDGKEVRSADLVAALLRLAPDGRDPRLARGLTGAVGDQVRYALGGERPAGSRRGLARRATAPCNHPASWVAAARARAPLAADPWLEEAGLVGAGRAAPVCTTVTVDPHRHSWTDARGLHHFVVNAYEVTIAGRVAVDDDLQPTAALGTAENWDDLGPWVEVLAGIWPHDAEHLLVPLAEPTAARLLATEVHRDGPRVLDAIAAHAGRLGPLAAAVLSAGLSAGRGDSRVHAVDAFADLVATGRMPAPVLASAMAAAAPGSTATRWAGALREATAAPGAAPAVVDVLTALLPALPYDLRGLHALLETLDRTTDGARVTDPALRGWLSSVPGSGAAARTARRLLG
jgi:hypothetical protein